MVDGVTSRFQKARRGRCARTLQFPLEKNNRELLLRKGIIGNYYLKITTSIVNSIFQLSGFQQQGQGRAQDLCGENHRKPYQGGYQGGFL